MFQEGPENVISRAGPSPEVNHQPFCSTPIYKLLEDFDEVRWGIACRKMQVHVIHGNPEAAHRALDYYFNEEIPQLATKESFLVNLLPLRISNALEAEGYLTVQSVMAASDEELLSRVDSFGVGALKKVRAVCDAVKNKRAVEVNPEEVAEMKAQ